MYGQPDHNQSVIYASDGDGLAGRLPPLSRPRVAPPRLVATQPAPEPLVTAADLKLPADLVRHRATQFAQYARACGAGHSLRLWRQAHRQAILTLTREAANLGDDAICEALFWEHHGSTYWVSATFTHRLRPQALIQ
jgi:hypothetical protein